MCQEFSFLASDKALTTACTNGHNLLAVAGHEEVVYLFDLATKRKIGELAGEHSQNITAVQATKTHVLSGGQDGQIVIWRYRDMEVVHTLKVKNVSPVKAMSLHPSGRMCLALYQNGVLRLWNLLDARCHFKKKVGLDDSSSSEEEDDDESENSDEVQKQLLNKYQHTPESVIWEPSEGKLYAVLFTRKLEVYSVENDKPLHSLEFDTVQTSLCFISATTLLITDTKARLTLLSNICDPEKVKMKLLETQLVKIRHAECFQGKFVSTISKKGIEFWDC